MSGIKKVTAIGGDFFQLAPNKPPLFGVSQMGAPQGGLSCPFGAIHLQVARQSRVGGGEMPPQSANADSSPIPCGTGEP